RAAPGKGGAGPAAPRGGATQAHLLAHQRNRRGRRERLRRGGASFPWSGAILAMNIYQQLDLDPIINVSGSVTRLGGAPMPEAVLDAFRAAAADCVPLDQLQAAASRVIAEITGAEAGIVVAGAAAGLLLGTAAILTGYDAGRMERLPHCDFPDEFIVAR